MTNQEIIQKFKELDTKKPVAAYDNGYGLSICDASGGEYTHLPAFAMIGLRIFHIPAPKDEVFDTEWPKLKKLVNRLVKEHNGVSL